MRYLLDADWAMSFLNGRADAVELIRQIASDGIALSTITYGEIFEGMVRRELSDSRFGQLAQLEQLTDFVLPDAEVARRYAVVRSTLRQQGLLIPDNDIWVAATALHLGLLLVTRDNHFTRIPGVGIYP